MKELSQHKLPALLFTFLTDERTRNHHYYAGPAAQVHLSELAPGQNTLGETGRHGRRPGCPRNSREQPASRSLPGSKKALNADPTIELGHLTY